MSKRARERGDKRDWPKLWGQEVQAINWPDLGNGRPAKNFHQRKAERIAERTRYAHLATKRLDLAIKKIGQKSPTTERKKAA